MTEEFPEAVHLTSQAVQLAHRGHRRTQNGGRSGMAKAIQQASGTGGNRTRCPDCLSYAQNNTRCCSHSSCKNELENAELPRCLVPEML